MKSLSRWKRPFVPFEYRTICRYGMSDNLTPKSNRYFLPKVAFFFTIYYFDYIFDNLKYADINDFLFSFQSKSSEKLFKKMKAASDAASAPQCEKCARPVYAMERVKAERRSWHKECFRCVQCNKQLTLVPDFL